MTGEATTKPEKGGGLSTRGAALAGAAATLLVLLAVLTALFWPEIQLRYHRHYFRNGTPEEQIEALDWICGKHLRRGMDKTAVERILGEPLEDRFTPHLLGVFLDPEATVSASVSAVVFSFADKNIFDGAYALCFRAEKSADSETWFPNEYLYAMSGHFDDGHFVGPMWIP